MDDTVSEKREPWLKRDTETDKAYRAFKLYLNRGVKRNMKDVAKDLKHKGPAAVYRWAAQHDWINRACAWDMRAVDRALEQAQPLQAHVEGQRIIKRLEAQAFALDVSSEAMQALREIINNKTASALARVNAAEVIFKHAGIVAPEDSKEVDASMDESVLIAWLVSLFDNLPSQDDKRAFKALAMAAIQGSGSVH